MGQVQSSTQQGASTVGPQEATKALKTSPTARPNDQASSANTRKNAQLDDTKPKSTPIETTANHDHQEKVAKNDKKNSKAEVVEEKEGHGG